MAACTLLFEGTKDVRVRCSLGKLLLDARVVFSFYKTLVELILTLRGWAKAEAVSKTGQFE